MFFQRLRQIPKSRVCVFQFKFTKKLHFLSTTEKIHVYSFFGLLKKSTAKLSQKIA